MDQVLSSLGIRSSTGTLVLTVIIFVALAILLYWLRSCGSWVPNTGLLIYVLLGSALYIALFYSLFTPGEWWWKLLIVVFIILLLYFDYVTINRCGNLKDYLGRLGINL